MAEEPREGGGAALVGAHPALAEAFAEAALAARAVPELGGYDRCAPRARGGGGPITIFRPRAPRPLPPRPRASRAAAAPA